MEGKQADRGTVACDSNIEYRQLGGVYDTEKTYNVNEKTNMEDKLDRIIELLEKLVAAELYRATLPSDPELGVWRGHPEYTIDQSGQMLRYDTALCDNTTGCNTDLRASNAF